MMLAREETTSGEKPYKPSARLCDFRGGMARHAKAAASSR